MAITPEGFVKRDVKRILDAECVYYFMPGGTGWGRAGIPDYVACVAGIFVGIECKAGNKTATALQQRELDKINKTGGLGLVINANNIDSLAKHIKALKLYGIK